MSLNIAHLGNTHSSAVRSRAKTSYYRELVLKTCKNLKDKAKQNRKVILKQFPLTGHVISVKNNIYNFISDISYIPYYIQHYTQNL